MQPIPVRTRLTLLRDGATTAERLVYCERTARSVPLARCAACPFGGAIDGDVAGPDRTVECACVALCSTTPPPEPAMAAVVAAGLPVGAALARTVTCLAEDVPLSQSSVRVAIDASAAGVPVVNARGVFSGLLPRAAVGLALLASSRERVSDRMVAPASAVQEADSLGAAFRDMCSRRARELIVVGSCGEVVGILRDVDAMRFVAYVTRTGSRPGRGIAA